MYTPPFNAVTDEAEIRSMVAAGGSAWFVTVAPDGTPEATAVPVIWRGETVIAHLARANRQWTTLRPDAAALLIVHGPQSYVSPSWYAAKAEHGRVVPTWNYSTVHLSGTVRVHQDPDWLRAAVTELTDLHETGREQPWQVSDAPADYLAGQLGGIVGIELTVTRVEGKAKLSQNRSAADRAGVITGLRREPVPDAVRVADAMSAD